MRHATEGVGTLGLLLLSTRVPAHYLKEKKVSIKINGYDLPVHISYSSLTTWLDCGHKYFLSRLVNEKEQPTWYLCGGSAVHTATELYDKEQFNVTE